MGWDSRVWVRVNSETFHHYHFIWIFICSSVSGTQSLFISLSACLLVCFFLFAFATAVLLLLLLPLRQLLLSPGKGYPLEWKYLYLCQLDNINFEKSKDFFDHKRQTVQFSSCCQSVIISQKLRLSLTWMAMSWKWLKRMGSLSMAKKANKGRLFF